MFFIVAYLSEECSTALQTVNKYQKYCDKLMLEQHSMKQWPSSLTARSYHKIGHSLGLQYYWKCVPPGFLP